MAARGADRAARAGVAASREPAAAREGEFPADATPVRHQAPRGDAIAHAVVAHTLAVAGRSTFDFRRRRPGVESEPGRKCSLGPAGNPARRRLEYCRTLGNTQ